MAQEAVLAQPIPNGPGQEAVSAQTIPAGLDHAPQAQQVEVRIMCYAASESEGTENVMAYFFNHLYFSFSSKLMTPARGSKTNNVSGPTCLLVYNMYV